MTWFNPATLASLDHIDRAAWEALCDGCGICCLYKVRAPYDPKTSLTCIACRYLDLQTCGCRVYEHRHDLMPTCLDLIPANVRQLTWLPETCAYRRIAEGKPLPWWHHLRSRKRDLVHRLGISVHGIAISEKDMDLNDLQKYTMQPW
ncbi:MAG TPA: YcgN family cysteine cluster protein [Anaerolineaceae bacterium]|nr:YcgN family cysteine cluster protein [Anaerolineaceae bacterium]